MSQWNRAARWTALFAIGLTMQGTVCAAMRVPENKNAIAVPERTTCDAGQRLQLTLGLPEDHPQIQTPLVNALTSGDRVCLSTARGNPYQLMSWLENDHLQVVVLPAYAVAILARDNPTFDDNYLVSDVSPFPLLRLQERPLGLVSSSASGEPAFTALFDRVNGTGAAPTVALPHHLSLSVDHLLTRAMQWSKDQNLRGDALARFQQRLTDGIRFQLPLNQPGELATDFRFVHLSSSEADRDPTAVRDRDLIVVHRHIVSSYPQLQHAIAAVHESNAAAVTEGLFGWTSHDKNKPGSFDTFYDANFTLHQRGSMSRRYYRFTVDELWGLLTTPPDQQSAGGFALVLTGGGVKAAYQTRLVERLYQNGQLRNAKPGVVPEATSASSTAASPHTHDVDYVIGTSGGALLGIFVSALDNEVTQRLIARGETALTSVLWGSPGERIRSRDIFPLQDMLRYGSIVACFLVLSWVGALSLRFFAASYPQVKRVTTVQGNSPPPKRWLRESPLWMALLLFAPVFIVIVARGKGLEHMPAISGVLYILMALIALDADQRYTPERKFEWHGWRVHLKSLVLFALGVVAILMSLRYPWKDFSQLAGCDDWQPAILLCSSGFVLISLALHSFFAKHSTTSDSGWRFLKAFGLIMGIVAASYLVLTIGIGLGKAAILELSGSFWIWLLGTALVLSVALMFFGARRADGTPRMPPAFDMVGFLFSEHPSRALVFGHRRLTRFVVLAAGAWAWWNLTAAPALYGNCNAREYFVETYQRFADAAGKPSDPLPLAVPFVVTATSLAKSQERYFMFTGARSAGGSTGDGTTGGSPGGRIDPEVWFKLVSDPRWLVVRDFSNSDLQSVAFASGSPFPVFSSHGVAIQSLALDERYIDGGFAHNRPVDAARALGASRVLVLNSSPLPGKAPPAKCTLFRIPLSELTCNLPLLVPYLWERSQTEDDLSSMSMLVASIYPTAEGGNWPMLTDFRGEVVDRLIAEADQDATRRIGVMESWGAPTLGDASLVSVNLGNLTNSRELRPNKRK